MAEQVADLYASLGLRINGSQWAQGSTAIQSVQSKLGILERASKALLPIGKNAPAQVGIVGRLRNAFGALGDAMDGTNRKANDTGISLGRLAGVAVAAFAGPRIYDALIGFNGRMEDARTTIAGLFAMVKKTDLAEQFAPADEMLANLQRRAKTLPGTTSDYVKTLSLIAQPLMAAGASMQEIEDITVNTVVASKALGVDTEVGARDVSQAARGQYHSVDQLTGAVLGVDGFDGDTGRAKFNALDKKARVKQLVKSFNTPQLAQMGEAQGKTFNGTLSTLIDNISILAGKIGLPIFQRLTAMFKEWNAWLDANADKVTAFGNAVADILVTAFESLVTVGGAVASILGFFAEHTTLATALVIGLGTVITAFAIQAAIDWAIAFWPVTLAIAAIAALYLVIQDLWEGITEGTGVTAAVLGWFSDLTDIIGAGIGKAIHAVGNAIRSVGTFLSRTWSTLRELAERVGGWFADIGGKIKGAFQDAYDYVVSLDWAKAVPILGKVGEALGRGAGAAVNAVTGDTYLEGIDEVSGPSRQMSAAPSVQVNPNVTVEVKGNIPADWIDAKVQGAVQDHHDTTWSNAANALGVESD
jgi:hypothetical protein